MKSYQSGSVQCKTKTVHFSLNVLTEKLNPFVRGKRWWVSTGRPLSLANLTLFSCFSLVNRVPSAKKRNDMGDL